MINICSIGGVAKIKSLMAKKTFMCRQCGMSYTYHREALECCAQQKSKYNKNRANFQKEYDKITGGSK